MLSEKQVAFYQDNGYILIENLITKEEAAALRAESHHLSDELSRREDNDATWQSARNTMQAATATRLLHCHDVQFQSALFTRLIVDERFTGAAADLIGHDDIQLHHTKMFIKPPEKGSPFPLHQDYPFFPHEGTTMTAAIFHFDDAPVEKGCVCVVPGSHKQGPRPHNPTGNYHLDPAEYPLSLAVPCPAKAGDVLFMNYLLVHGSGVNVSQEARTTLLVQFRSSGDRPTVQTHLSKGQGMMLRGFNHGPMKAMDW